MADMEEKVQYQSDERLRDVNEVLENCQTRVSGCACLHIIRITNQNIILDIQNGAYVSAAVRDRGGNWQFKRTCTRSKTDQRRTDGVTGTFVAGSNCSRHYYAVFKD